MFKKCVCLACAVLSIPALAACGSSGSSAPGGSAPVASSGRHLTKAQFVARGDAICTKANAQLDAAAHKTLGSGKPTAKDFKRFAVQSVLPISEATLAQLRQLAAPQGDETSVSGFLNADQAAIDKVKSSPAALATGDPFAKAQKLAAGYGLKACGPQN